MLPTSHGGWQGVLGSRPGADNSEANVKVISQDVESPGWSRLLTSALMGDPTGSLPNRIAMEHGQSPKKPTGGRRRTANWPVASRSSHSSTCLMDKSDTG